MKDHLKHMVAILFECYPYRWNGSGFSVVRSDFTNEIPYFNAS